ncbi:hypothetical protein BDP27DRAFT_1383750 [Rhodocollybia butyracea]|uniref:DNA-binding protein RAP1 n=1 Tax=Rhodocollybia butyracea TaxID=206335 RepID=A0A9P5PRW2_9AGAR|nr:hypothetical protein BDP27DRAFT_1383750 [Rhodocollybia butyracea]
MYNSGIGVHFFIQPELIAEIQDALRQSITELGGEIDAEISDNGHILTDLSNQDTPRLFQLFGPQRVVPFTYVEACKAAGIHLQPIFFEEGAPLGIHIHESIANVKFREALCEKIMICSGYPYATVDTARIIIADSKTNVFNTLVKLYQLSPNKYVESLEWVDKCIEQQNVTFTPHVFRNPGGRRAGEERTQFTEEDEHKLCEWIAAKIPYKSTGGRTGNKLYQQLCEMHNQPEYAWVARHTWQSWRERYKKHSPRLDKLIDNVVSTTKPTPGEKWQYGYVRQGDEKPPRKKRRRVSKSEGSQQQQEPQQQSQLLPEFIVGSSGAGKEHIHPDPAAHLSQAFPESPALGQLAGILRLGPEEDQDWSIRVGNDLPPAWAKPKDLEDGQDHKTAKSPEPATMTEATLQLALTVAVAAGHVLDQNLANIAQETRFTMEEVREYYDKYTDLDRTRRRFLKLREHVNLIPDEE